MGHALSIFKRNTHQKSLERRPLGGTRLTVGVQMDNNELIGRLFHCFTSRLSLQLLVFLPGCCCFGECLLVFSFVVPGQLQMTSF